MKRQIDAIYIGSYSKINTSKENDINIRNLSKVEDVFTLLSDPKFNADAIIIEVDSDNKCNNLYELITALKVVIGCTVQRLGSGKPTRRNTKICAAMRPDVDKNIARDFINMKEIEGFFISLNDSTYEEFTLTINEILGGSRALPKRLHDHLHPKRIKTQDSAIKLTPRQTQILHMVSERGSSNKVIARILNISESTVKLHMSAILKKFGVRNRTQLAIFSKNT